MNHPTIPAGAALRVIGDVHGELRAFEHALATDRFVVQLGDLVDYGPDSAGVLRAMFAAMDAGRGLFVLGNHDHKIARAIAGQGVQLTADQHGTLAQLDEGLRARLLAEARRAPAWLRTGRHMFVHGGFHDGMLGTPPPTGLGRAEGLLARALYGQGTGRTRADGFPERSIAWVSRIPAGMTVYCGHDRRSTDGRPARFANAAGGAAVFLDTGAGKGGHLSWIDLPT